ncbi:MAG: CHAD domain-containing protein, partial [Nocardiopsaceae bacterium]|nr:CHAD domain-containing protein [Nocardiopsaceae bacterium]
GTLTVPVTGWQPSRPHFARDLPPGALADRVGKLIAPRALLPLAAVTQTVAVSRLLNADDKTVARLVVERPVLVKTGQPVGPRFTIQPVRGYPGQARRAARVLAETEGVTHISGPGLAGPVLTGPVLTDTVFTAALAALGREPGDYSNKVSAPVTAGMPASQAVAVVLLDLLDTMEANKDGVLRDIDPEFLHDFRVAVRRTRSALKLFGPALITAREVVTATNKRAAGDTVTARRIEQAAAEFKWLGDLTTPTRDLDVHLLGFDDMEAGLRAAKPDDLEPFRAYLRERRARECRALARGLRSPRFRELTGQWRAALTPIAEARKPARGASVRYGERSAVVLAAERTRRAFAKVTKRGAAITPDSPHESLHDLRKRCKELRYALEFFAPLHDRAYYAPVLADLKKLQDCLGDFHDNEVQIAEIRALATEMQAAGEAPAVTLLALGEVTAGLARNQASARDDFERRFAAFAGADGQRRMAMLLREGGA